MIEHSPIDDMVPRSGSPSLPAIEVSLAFIQPGKARSILSECGWEGRQRNISQDYVQDLIFVLQNKQWKITTIETCTLDRREYLTDGQHRLTAIAESGIGAWVILSRKTVQNEAELAAEYYRADRGRSRSSGDAIRALGIREEMTNGDNPPLTSPQLGIAMSAFNLIRVGFGWEKPAIRTALHLRNQDQYVNDFEEWLPCAIQYFQSISGANVGLTTGLSRTMVVAVGMVTFRHKPERAEEFWSQVARAKEIDSIGPIYRLRETVKEKPVKKDSKMSLGLRNLIYSQRVAQSWNAFYRGDTQSQILKRRPDRSPILIEGTPYNGETISSYAGGAIVTRKIGRRSKSS